MMGETNGRLNLQRQNNGFWTNGRIDQSEKDRCVKPMKKMDVCQTGD